VHLAIAKFQGIKTIEKRGNCNGSRERRGVGTREMGTGTE